MGLDVLCMIFSIVVCDFLRIQKLFLKKLHLALSQARKVVAVCPANKASPYDNICDSPVSSDYSISREVG